MAGKVAILCLGVAGLLAGCRLGGAARGTLALVIQAEAAAGGGGSAASFVRSYSLEGQGPRGASFGLTDRTETTVVVESLAAGDWLVTVRAWDAAAKAVGIGSVAARVTASRRVEATVRVLCTVGAAPTPLPPLPIRSPSCPGPGAGTRCSSCTATPWTPPPSQASEPT